MGKAAIVAAHGGGEYTIEIQYDRARSDAEAESLEAQRAILAEKISEQNAAISDRWTEYDTATATLNAAVIAYRDNPVPETSQALQTASTAALTASRALGSARRQLALLNYEDGRIVSRLEVLASLLSSREVSAWCADYTEDLSGDVGTIEIQRRERLEYHIRPGYFGAAHTDARDGQLQHTLSGTPSGTFVNYALLPGADKWRPVFRYGVITALETVTDTADVELEEALSGHQQLDINQSETLEGIPVVYMSCHAEAFAVGDRVLVEFPGEWETARVVGFAANPRPCDVTLWAHDYAVSALQSVVRIRDEARGLAYMFNTSSRTLYAEAIDGSVARTSVYVPEVIRPALPLAKAWDVIPTSRGIAFVFYYDAYGGNCTGDFKTVTVKEVPVAFSEDGTALEFGALVTRSASFESYEATILPNGNPPTLDTTTRTWADLDTQWPLFHGGGYNYYRPLDGEVSYLSGTIPTAWPESGEITDLTMEQPVWEVRITDGVPSIVALATLTGLGGYDIFSSFGFGTILPDNPALATGKTTALGQAWELLLAYDWGSLRWWQGRRQLTDYGQGMPWCAADWNVGGTWAILPPVVSTAELTHEDGSAAWHVWVKSGSVAMRIPWEDYARIMEILAAI